MSQLGGIDAAAFDGLIAETLGFLGNRQEEAIPLTEDGALLKALLSEKGFAEAEREVPTLRDVRALRMRLLCRDIVNRLYPLNRRSAAEGDAAADVGTLLFNFVIQQVPLISHEAVKKTPLSVYEALVFGVGTAEHRAWAFAELARQLQFDVVLLTPKAEGRRSLVGVIGTEGRVWLFDPLLGVPVPAADTPEGWNTPATLTEARENSALLKALEVAEAPPLSADDLKDLTVQLIGDSTVWSQRSARWNDATYVLEKAGRRCLFFSGLGDRRRLVDREEIRIPGLKTRVDDLGKTAGWAPADVRVWEFPEIAMEAVDAAGADPNSPYSLRFVIMLGPKALRKTPGQPVKEVLFERPLHQVRVEQLQGEPETLPHYGPMRGFHTKPEGKSIGNNRETVEQATYWIALTQFESGKFEAVTGTLDQHKREFPAGRFAAAAARLRAQLLNRSGKTEDAISVLKELPKDANRFGDALLIRRWSH